MANDGTGERMPRGPYRDGTVWVQANRCKTCIFRAGNLMSLQNGRVKNMVRQCLEDETGSGNIPCHETLSGDQAICRGFWDGYRDRVWVLQLAERMGIVREVDPR